jgi:tRNA pseudouridine13 synthase
MLSPVAHLPFLTHDLPGIGGVLRSRPEDFEVEEIPAYEPEGQGDHLFLWVEKRELTSWDVVNGLSSALGIAAADIGIAGMKDKHAVTRQQVSIPAKVDIEDVRAITLEGVKVLAVKRHPHKLRTGHLKGNRFRIVVRDPETADTEARDRAAAILGLLCNTPGCPNWFGGQRFGRDGDNAERGRALLSSGKKGPKGRKRRLLISAFQSQLFNEYLATRMRDGLTGRVLPGDVLQKTDTGGLFSSEDPEVDQARFDRGELVITGPIFGHKMRRPTEGEARRREQAVLDHHQLELASFRPAGKIAQGTRRALAVRLRGVSTRIAGPAAVEVAFELPKGSYATAVLREVMKGPTDFPN